MNGLFTSVTLFFFLYLIDSSHGAFQRWLSDTNFDNPSNWNSGRSPCGNDLALIADESPVVYLQVNTTVRELVLPKSGEVILGPTVNLGFTQQADPRCPSTSGDVEFTGVHPKAWLNPANWCSTQTEQGPCDVTSPKLDVEKIPCAFDDVVMPRQHSYYIDLSEGARQLTVKSLKITGSSFTTSSFANYLANQDGRRMFKTATQPSSKTSVKITRTPCNDKSGCPCGNDQPMLAEKICSHVEKHCARPKCKRTIQPVGACCRMCGAVFNITKGYGYNHEGFVNTVRTSFYTGQVKQDINMTFFITHDGWIQLVLNDKTGAKSAALAKTIKKDMEVDLSKGGHKYAIDGVQLMLSMGAPLGPPSAHAGNSMSSGSVAGVVIAILIILVILVVATIFFVFKRTGREIPKMPTISMPSVSMPTLPRLPRRMPRATARVPAQPHSAANDNLGFANPFYDSSPIDDGNAVVKEMELMSVDEEQPTFGISAGGGFNNPLYGTQDAMFDDPTKQTSTKSKEPTAAAATGSAKATANLPPTDASAKMILVDIDDDKNTSTI